MDAYYFDRFFFLKSSVVIKLFIQFEKSMSSIFNRYIKGKNKLSTQESYRYFCIIIDNILKSNHIFCVISHISQGMS